MRIAMIGAGGIGGYLGARLVEAGADVSFIARGAHLQAMRQDGLRIQSDLGNVFLPSVSASDAPADIGPVDLAIFAVKLYDSEKAAAALGPLISRNTRIVTLQNGIDSVETLGRYVPGDQVIGGATYLSAFIKQPGEVVHAGGLRDILVGGHRDPLIKDLQALCDRAVGIELKPVADIALNSQAVPAHCLQVGTASNEADIASRLGEPCAEVAADAARPYHCDPHPSPRRQLPPLVARSWNGIRRLTLALP